MVPIEIKEALENVEATAAVPGIDNLFIGPFDLDNNIGYPIVSWHDLCIKIYMLQLQKILKAANAAGKKAGIFCNSGEQAKGYADQGVHMISVATDIHILPQCQMAAANEAKGQGDGPKLTGSCGR